MFRASGSIQVNVSRIQQLGDEWNSDTLKSVAKSLSDSSDSANSGDLTGNRMFYANDYMVSSSIVVERIYCLMCPCRFSEVRDTSPP